MRLLHDKPNEGKTTKLILIAHALPGTYVVVPERRDATRLFHYAIKMGTPIPFPITYEDYLFGRFSTRGIQGFVFDDVDRFLAQASRGVNMVAASWTTDLPPDEEEEEAG